MQARFVSRLRSFWRLAVPFWLFRDASRGGASERRASYRYNRAQRQLLPFFLGKWVILAFCLLQAMWPLTQLLAAVPAGPGHVLVLLACVVTGVAFAFACVVLTLLAAAYLYFCLVEE